MRSPLNSGGDIDDEDVDISPELVGRLDCGLTKGRVKGPPGRRLPRKHYNVHPENTRALELLHPQYDEVLPEGVKILEATSSVSNVAGDRLSIRRSSSLSELLSPRVSDAFRSSMTNLDNSGECISTTSLNSNVSQELLTFERAWFLSMPGSSTERSNKFHWDESGQNDFTLPESVSASSRNNSVTTIPPRKLKLSFSRSNLKETTNSNTKLETRTTSVPLKFRGSKRLLGTELSYQNGPMNDVDPEKFNQCNGFPHFVQRQKYLCLKSNKVFAAISAGARLGIQECQSQLHQHRWNCSIVRDAENVFGKVLAIRSREKAYFHAISAASLAFEITKACARGELEDCSCDEHVRGRNTKGKWQWGGCSEDVKYGTLFSKEFVDSMETTESAIGLMNLHNNEAGRRLLKTSMNMSCKCHGVSGSCTMKVCWRVLPSFRSVGERIVEKFEGAFHVKPVNRGLNKKGHKHSKLSLKPSLHEMKRPTKKDLVFIDDSPDYCEENNTIHILGTRGRVCNRSSTGPDGCKLLCCGRGYKTMVREGFESCNCQFVWCCRVQCESCPYKRDEYICN